MMHRLFSPSCGVHTALAIALEAATGALPMTQEFKGRAVDLLTNCCVLQKALDEEEDVRMLIHRVRAANTNGRLSTETRQQARVACEEKGFPTHCAALQHTFRRARRKRSLTGIVVRRCCE
ncbi:hypothetical protein B0H11DRAFT_163598 [Mycena galericulata]|nr:hypothetical protein B0H11DRAFT_163598 [Mycena galericulata]